MSRDVDESPIEIQRYLKGVRYPADNQSLAETAGKNGAPDDVVELLEQLPRGHYENPADVTKAYGHVH